MKENIYRTHNLGELRESDIGKKVRISGFVRTIRDHGGVQFVDLRDNFGVTQVVVHDESLLKGITKETVIKVEGEVKENDKLAMEKGVTLVDGTTFKKCKVKIVEIKDRKTKLEVQITEGKNREIRKIFEHFGYNVIFLKRISIGKIKLGGLTRGTCRLLRQSEIEYLKSL